MYMYVFMLYSLLMLQVQQRLNHKEPFPTQYPLAVQFSPPLVCPVRRSQQVLSENKKKEKKKGLIVINPVTTSKYQEEPIPVTPIKFYHLLG